MNDFRQYFEQLLQKYRMPLEKKNLPVLNNFLADPFATEAFALIAKTQQEIIVSWKESLAAAEITNKPVMVANGTVGQPYEFFFDLAKMNLPAVADFYVEVKEETGLVFSKEEKKLSGIVKQPGEHTIIMNFSLSTDRERPRYYKKSFKLFINPDPKSLWANIDSDKADPYWKPDNSSAGADFFSKRLVIGSKRGRGHAHEAKFRDDDYGFDYQEETGWGIIAVADGAGSAKYSRKGSAIACETVINFFKNTSREKWNEIDELVKTVLENGTAENQKMLSNLLIDQIGKAAFSAQVKIREEALQKNADIKDFSTTLIFALVRQFAGKYVIASFWVGDGGIGIYNREARDIFVLGVPDSGDFAGQTRFVTMEEIFTNGAYVDRVRVKIVDNFTALILMTDGITDPKFQTDAALARVGTWDKLWEDMNGTNEENVAVDFAAPSDIVRKDIMNWLDFWSPGNHDDRTIAILY